MIRVCKDCEKRQIGCHGICEEYIVEKEKNDKRREEIKRAKDRKADARAFRDSCFRKTQRARGIKA